MSEQEIKTIEVPQSINTEGEVAQKIQRVRMKSLKFSIPFIAIIIIIGLIASRFHSNTYFVNPTAEIVTVTLIENTTGDEYDIAIEPESYEGERIESGFYTLTTRDSDNNIIYDQSDYEIVINKDTSNFVDVTGSLVFYVLDISFMYGDKGDDTNPDEIFLAAEYGDHVLSVLEDYYTIVEGPYTKIRDEIEENEEIHIIVPINVDVYEQMTDEELFDYLDDYINKWS